MERSHYFNRRLSTIAAIAHVIAWAYELIYVRTKTDSLTSTFSTTKKTCSWKSKKGTRKRRHRLLSKLQTLLRWWNSLLAQHVHILCLNTRKLVFAIMNSGIKEKLLSTQHTTYIYNMYMFINVPSVAFWYNILCDVMLEACVFACFVRTFSVCKFLVKSRGKYKRMASRKARVCITLTNCSFHWLKSYIYAFV